MALNPAIMRAVEDLNYRVTVGDVASQVGLDVKLAEQGLLGLASDAGGHMQVAESGEIAYLFPKNFRGVLRNKFWRLRIQDWWNRVWNVLFYLIRISFGILLILSIVVVFVTIAIIMMSLNSREGDRNRQGGFGGGGFIFLPRMFFGPDLFWFFSPNYYRYRRYQTQTPQRSRRRAANESEMNFLEAVFSFLFGDGNPNADLEEKRWRAIATVIRNNDGAVIAEQITPYLDDLGSGYENEYEDYMLPVLTRFSGRPEVSPNGDIIYHFPALQVMAEKQGKQSVASYLKEAVWKFSNASSGKLTLAAGLGGVNIAGAAILGVLLQNLRAEGAIAQIGGWIGFVDSIYWLLLAYAVGFLAVPLVRYLWIRNRNRRIETRNEQRQQQAEALNAAADELKPKIDYAHQFAAETVITEADLAYTTETDLMLQESEQSDKIDAEWRRRLEQSGSL